MAHEGPPTAKTATVSHVESVRDCATRSAAPIETPTYTPSGTENGRRFRDWRTAATNVSVRIANPAGGRPRWRLRHRNGNVIADGGEGYASRSNAVEAVTRVKANAPGAEAVEK